MNSRTLKRAERVINTWQKIQKNDYPMKERCNAKTRSGKLCQKFPLTNGRCRLHGGRSLSGSEHGRYVTGRFTKESIQRRKMDALMVLAITTLLELDTV